jgi:hypothetical protein
VSVPPDTDPVIGEDKPRCGLDLSHVARKAVLSGCPPAVANTPDGARMAIKAFFNVIAGVRARIFVGIVTRDAGECLPALIAKARHQPYWLEADVEWVLLLRRRHESYRLGQTMTLAAKLYALACVIVFDSLHSGVAIPFPGGFNVRLTRSVTSLAANTRLDPGEIRPPPSPL